MKAAVDLVYMMLHDEVISSSTLVSIVIRILSRRYMKNVVRNKGSAFSFLTKSVLNSNQFHVV